MLESNSIGLIPFLQTVINFLNPIAMNGLLTYLGEGGKNAIIRPWVWIFLLFLSPMVGSVVFHWLVHFVRTISE